MTKILIPILIVALVSAFAFLYNNKTSQSKLTAQLTPAATSPNPTSTPKITNPTSTSMPESNQKRYTNAQLGVSFVTPINTPEMSVSVKAVEDKIYVYNSKYSYTQGQYVQVFKKSPSDNLETAIKKQFLTNIPASDCFVKDTQYDSKYPSSYQIKTLGYKTDPNSDLPAWAQDNSCPKPYAESNGISYFLADSQHPNIFLFVSIGQYGLPVDAEGKQDWQDTIQFL